VLLKENKKYPILQSLGASPTAHLSPAAAAARHWTASSGPTWMCAVWGAATLFLVKRVVPLRQRPSPLRERNLLNLRMALSGVC